MAITAFHPEDLSRAEIDAKLAVCGWIVQSRAEMNLAAGAGIAVREFGTGAGPADYGLFVDKEFCGVIEAKPAGTTLSGYADQAATYISEAPEWLGVDPKKRRFEYVASDTEILFRDHADPQPRSRRVFAFHRPETLRRSLSEPETLRARLRHLPALVSEGLRTCQIEAIDGLENSLAHDDPRALIQMTMGAGKTFTACTMSYRLLAHAGVRRILFLRALIAAKDTGADIPIVVVACDPLEKLLGSLARPGGNATGISCVSADLIGKRFGQLKAVVPSLKRVALLFNPEDISEIELREATNASNSLNVEIMQFPVKSPDDFKGAFERMVQADCGAIYVSLSAFTNFHAKRLSEFALQQRLPLVSSGPEFPEVGALMSYGFPLVEGFKRSAYFIDRILKGTSPKELPAEEPTKFYMVINAKTAATLGIKIPDMIQVQADRIIE